MFERPLRVFFYVQHLLGIGHLVRAGRIAKAFADAGHDVDLVMGGVGTPHFEIGAARVVALTPVRSGDDGFHALVHADGRPFDAADRAARVADLLGHFDRRAPDVLIVEAFPFGRSQMAFELEPLLQAARAKRPRPLIVASVRDILQANRRPERIAETVDRVQRFFDLVMVHGDPRIVRLEHTFPQAEAFAEKVVYTGLVAPQPVVPEIAEGAPSVVVSAGGGAVGAELLDAALRARPLTRFAEAPWLVLTGPNLPDSARARLADAAGAGVRFERFVPDLVRHLAQAKLSISQAGYNTVGDVLVAGCRAVLVPYAAAGEQEQSVRARLLEELGLAAQVSEADLTPETLAGTIETMMERAPPPGVRLNIDGGANSVMIVEALRRQAEGR